MKNFKIYINRITKEHLNSLRKDGFKNPIFIQLDVPNKWIDTLTLLIFKIKKDLKYYHVGDSDFYIERENLPTLRKYVKNYYSNFFTKGPGK
jgi:hypothetical protein